MPPKIFINIATNEIGGPGKGLLQFLRCGGLKICDPVIVGFKVKEKTQFDLAMDEAGVSFEMLEQRSTYDPLLIFRAMDVVKRYKPDILQSHGYKSHVVCLILKIITKKPWIAFFHGWVNAGFKIKCYTILDKFLFRFADRVVPVSEGMVAKLNLKWIGKNKISVIHNAVDPEEFSLNTCNHNVRKHYNIDNTAPLLALVGRFSQEKGHACLLNALPAILESVPTLRVIFVGDGPLKSQIQARVDEAGLQRCVVFTGYQDNVQPFYNEIDLLVLPSLSEGMPNVALEAMLFAKPVIATRVGGVPEVVVEGITGTIIDPENPEQLADAIIDMFQNREVMQAYGSAGRERVLNEFSPGHRVNKISALYEDVLRCNSKNQRPKVEKNGCNQE